MLVQSSSDNDATGLSRGVSRWLLQDQRKRRGIWTSVKGVSANGAEYNSQGQVRSAAEHVAPGTA